MRVETWIEGVKGSGACGQIRVLVGPGGVGRSSCRPARPTQLAAARVRREIEIEIGTPERTWAWTPLPLCAKRAWCAARPPLVRGPTGHAPRRGRVGAARALLAGALDGAAVAVGLAADGCAVRTLHARHARASRQKGSPPFPRASSRSPNPCALPLSAPPAARATAGT